MLVDTVCDSHLACLQAFHTLIIPLPFWIVLWILLTIAIFSCTVNLLLFFVMLRSAGKETAESSSKLTMSRLISLSSFMEIMCTKNEPRCACSAAVLCRRWYWRYSMRGCSRVFFILQKISTKRRFLCTFAGA